MNYNPSTIARIADINMGIRVDKGPILATAHLAIQVYPLFNVIGGRVQINQIIGEVTTVFAADATLLKYYFTPTAGAQIDLTAISATAASMAVGKRFLAAGTIGGTFTFSGIGASMNQPIPYILGQVGVGGVIGIQSTTVAMSSGAVKYSIFYVPIDDGVYIEAA